MNASTLLTISDGIADLVAAVAPSVVQVEGRRRPASGLVFAPGGVVTTARALGADDGLRIRTHDGRTLNAEFAGWDPATHIAVLRSRDLEAAPARRADTPARVGHLAVAIARSWSNAVTASAGLVAIIGGPLRTGRYGSIEQVIRTTAPMHDGFAGGPLVNVAGSVIGISTAAAIRGLTVVIPSAIAWKAAEHVLEHGSPKRGFLGVAGQAVRVTDPQRNQIQREQALLIIGVTSGSPADAAGMMVGDVIFEFDGRAVQSAEDLLDLLGGAVDRAVTVRLLRGGSIQQLTATVGQRPR